MTTSTTIRKAVVRKKGRRIRGSVCLGCILIITQTLVAQSVNEIKPTQAPAGATQLAATDLRQSETPEHVYFHEDFHDNALRQRGWEYGEEVRATTGEEAASSADPGAVFSWNGPGGRKRVELRSREIDLAGASGVELSYTFQHLGAEIGEHFFVDFLNARGRWIRIDEVRSDGRDTTHYARRTRLLPTAALHAGFRIRFTAQINDADDAWRLGEVSVREYVPLRTLTVRFEPERSADVSVVLDGRYDAMQVDTPFARRFPTGAHIFLIAPPTNGGDVFSHWSVGSRMETRRVLAVDLAEDVDARAHYRAWSPQRNGTRVALTTRPYNDVRIKLGYEPGQWLIEVPADTEIPALTGEWLLLLAPQRTPRLAFERWIVNGERMREGETLLEHQIEGADVITAEYALLGDVNGDDRLDRFDVDIFIAALIDPEGYRQMYPNLDRAQRCDINGDGVCDTLDLEAFVNLLTAE